VPLVFLSKFIFQYKAVVCIRFGFF
jgi:hypothetical protein